MRQDRVDWTDIDIVGRIRLYRVLKERLQSEDDILHAFDILDAVDELIHRALALSQLHLPILVPESVITHLRIRLRHLRS